MWQPRVAQWWCLVIVSLLVVSVWPPRGETSLAVKVVNWAVDPFDELPVLPAQLGLGLGDDFEAVNARDAVVRRYDELNMRGGWTRRRLRLKVATDPLNPATERQVLTGIGVLTAFLVWRFGARKP